MQWLHYGSDFHIFIRKLQDKINQKKTRRAYFQLFHSYISMQGVNGFSPPSKRHPVAPTTLKEKGEVPIPLPVLCSRGGGSGRRQLYTKMTDHRFCCLPACLPACLVFSASSVAHRLSFDSRVGCRWECTGSALCDTKSCHPWFWHSQYVTELDWKRTAQCPVTFCVLGVALLSILAFCDAMMCQLGNRCRRFEQTTTFYLTLRNVPKDLNPYVQWSAFSKRYFLVI